MSEKTKGDYLLEIAELKRQIERRDARVWVLENSLRHYGTHSYRCDKSRFVNPATCTCGYDAALAAEKENNQ